MNCLIGEYDSDWIGKDFEQRRDVGGRKKSRVTWNCEGVKVTWISHSFHEWLKLNVLEFKLLC